MPRDLFVDLVFIVQPLEANAVGDEQLVGELLFFPELQSFGNNAKRILKVQEGIAVKILEAADPIELSRRLPPPRIEQETAVVELDAPGRGRRWGAPLSVPIHYLHWTCHDGTRVARVPVLGIEMVASNPERFEERLRREVLFALARMGVRHSLFDLALVARHGPLEVRRVTWNTYPLTPIERHERSEFADDESRRVLPEVGRRLEPGSVPEAFERDAVVRQLATMLTGRRAASVLLVGESGCGKTAVVHELVRRSSQLGLGGRPVWQTSGSRIVAGMSGFGEWQERCRSIAREAAESSALLCLGNLFELLQVGQSSCSSESVGTFFRGPLVRGEFVAVAECTPRELALIEQFEPRILDAFRRLDVEALTPAAARSIVHRHAVRIASREGAVPPEVIERVLSLHRRYAGYSALPGKVIRFVERTHEARHDPREALTREEVDREFAAETGLPAILLDESAGMDLDNVAGWFRERIIGQDEAVALVVDTIAAIKARVTRPGKPLGSFFFIGPTGVGKTELAKTLADFFYGSKERLVRIDMSEFSEPGSAGRLVSAGRRDEEGILTAQLRDQPFSVVLLDEIEKADASVYDLFLQVLGEARLTDGAGRLADFSNAIVILTSNLGAREFRTERPGFHDPRDPAAPVAADHFSAAVRGHFRPEFFNRIDRVAPFLPLDRDAVRAVVRRELARCDGRDGLRHRNLSLVVHPAAIDRLAVLGYDPRYGARPVRRAIEQRLLRPLGAFLGARREPLANGFVEVPGFDDDDRPRFRFVPAAEEPGGRRPASVSGRLLSRLRRRFQRLNAGGFLNELRSESSRLGRQLEKRPATVPPAAHERFAELTRFIGRFETACDEILAAEERLVMARIRHEPETARAAVLRSAPDEAAFRSFAIEAMAMVRQVPDRIVLGIRADGEAAMRRAAETYRAVAGGFGSRWRVGYWSTRPPDALRNPEREGESRPVLVTGETEQERLFKERPGDCAAIALELSGGHVALRFATEAGLHVWVDEDGDKSMAFVHCFTEGQRLEEAWLPDAVLGERDWSKIRMRRKWDAKERRLRDSVLGPSSGTPGKLPWEFGAAALAELTELIVLEAVEAGMA